MTVSESKPTACIQFRLEKKSRRKDDQRYKVAVVPDYGATPLVRRILAPVLSRPICVLSKRKTIAVAAPSDRVITASALAAGEPLPPAASAAAEAAQMLRALTAELAAMARTAEETHELIADHSNRIGRMESLQRQQREASGCGEEDDARGGDTSLEAIDNLLHSIGPLDDSIVSPEAWTFVSPLGGEAPASGSRAAALPPPTGPRAGIDADGATARDKDTVASGPTPAMMFSTTPQHGCPPEPAGVGASVAPTGSDRATTAVPLPASTMAAPQISQQPAAKRSRSPDPGGDINVLDDMTVESTAIDAAATPSAPRARRPKARCTPIADAAHPRDGDMPKRLRPRRRTGMSEGGSDGDAWPMAAAVK